MPEVQSSVLSAAIGCKSFYKHVPQFGERAYIAEGKEVDVVMWDKGNNWCDILLVIPKGCKECEGKLQKYYRRLEEALAEFCEYEDCV